MQKELIQGGTSSFGQGRAVRTGSVSQPVSCSGYVSTSRGVIYIAVFLSLCAAVVVLAVTVGNVSGQLKSTKKCGCH
jgi:hypothetical protein